MWRATLRGLLAHKVRLLLTALAVVMGVSFVAGTLVLTDTMNRTFDTLFREITAGVTVEVRSPSRFRDFQGNDDRRPVPESLARTLAGVPGTEVVEGSLRGYAQLVDPRTKKAISNGQAPTFGVNWLRDRRMSSLRLKDGREPRAAGEVAIDAGTAADHSIRVGNTVTVLVEGPPLKVRVVGTFTFGTANNLAGATLTAFDTATAQRVLGRRDQFDSVVMRAADGVSDDTLKQRVVAALGVRYEVVTGAESGEQAANAIQDALGFFQTALLVFAGIAVFVGAFIIFNTFTILVAQRTRELALLRALGASKRQVVGSVLAEAGLVGALSSALGLAAGVLMAFGLRGLLRAFGLDLPAGQLVVLPHTVVWAFVVGTGVTTAAAVLPARRAAAVPPVAAMRAADAAARPRSLRRRAISGGALTALGAGLLALGLSGGVGNAAAVVGAGAAATFYGVATLSPLLAVPVVRAVGAPLPRLLGRARRFSGVAKATEIGRQNALRNPRRTASTAAALMVGLALVSAVSVLASSIKQSTSDLVDKTIGADYLVVTQHRQPFSPAIARELDRLPETAAVAALRFGFVRVDGSIAQLVAASPARLREVMRVDVLAGSLDAVRGEGTVALSKSEADERRAGVGDEVAIDYAGVGVRQAEVVAVYDTNQLLGSLLVSLESYDATFSRKLDTIVMIAGTPGRSPEAVRAAIRRVTERYPNVSLRTQAEAKRDQQKQIDQVLGLISALLLLSVLIAVLGIMNTLALSVFERTRELGLVRAIGMNRRQVRAMVRYESVLIAVFGAALGLALGTLFGWSLVRAFRDEGISRLVVPFGQLSFYVVLAAVFGVVAAIWPAHRAARLDVLRAISYE